ncbi:hypothetical protein SAY87_024171 [Trapa incisa]|uniref:Uncharacterized protein n=1 Tax=Trapa incisa TaxID=236973 RepID=A0AAN7QUE1_9MYRT|nr:hypothetical protein SAY87_024171 [Trapa incisa]
MKKRDCPKIRENLIAPSLLWWERRGCYDLGRWISEMDALDAPTVLAVDALADRISCGGGRPGHEDQPPRPAGYTGESHAYDLWSYMGVLRRGKGVPAKGYGEEGNRSKKYGQHSESALLKSKIAQQFVSGSHDSPFAM